MSDLSEPQPSLQEPALAPPVREFAWPTPDLACYPAAEVAAVALACQVEGLNGNTIEGTVKGATSGAWNATRAACWRWRTAG